MDNRLELVVEGVLYPILTVFGIVGNLGIALIINRHRQLQLDHRLKRGVQALLLFDTLMAVSLTVAYSPLAILNYLGYAEEWVHYAQTGAACLILQSRILLTCSVYITILLSIIRVSELYSAQWKNIHFILLVIALGSILLNIVSLQYGCGTFKVISNINASSRAPDLEESDPSALRMNVFFFLFSYAFTTAAVLISVVLIYKKTVERRRNLFHSEDMARKSNNGILALLFFSFLCYGGHFSVMAYHDFFLCTHQHPIFHPPDYWIHGARFDSLIVMSRFVILIKAVFLWCFLISLQRDLSRVVVNAVSSIRGVRSREVEAMRKMAHMIEKINSNEINLYGEDTKAVTTLVTELDPQSKILCGILETDKKVPDYAV